MSTAMSYAHVKRIPKGQSKRTIQRNWQHRIYCRNKEHLRIDRNFCSVHKEITSIRLYTPCNPRGGLRKCVYNPD
jgi:hypothetical protein